MGAEKVLVESVWWTCTHCTSWLIRGRVCLLQRGFSFGTSHRPNHWHIDAEVPTSSKALGWLGWDPPMACPFFDVSPLLTRILVDKCLMVHVWCAMLQLPVWSCFESHQSWYHAVIQWNHQLCVVLALFPAFGRRVDWHHAASHFLVAYSGGIRRGEVAWMFGRWHSIYQPSGALVDKKKSPKCHWNKRHQSPIWTSWLFMTVPWFKCLRLFIMACPWCLHITWHCGLEPRGCQLHIRTSQTLMRRSV